MRIGILGNGGAINDGLPYNAFIIDSHTLVEAPPDIMQSLYREGIAPLKLRQLFISHLHGDHCFGFPFLALALFFAEAVSGRPGRIAVFSPAGGDAYLARLTEMALGPGHPCLEWIGRRVDFIDLAGEADITLAERKASLFRMDHIVETHGFVLKEGGDTLLAYSADTRWCEALGTMISEGPRAVIVDLNGEPSDPVKVHLAQADLIERGLPLAGERTMFYGTHLKSQKTSSHPKIIYVFPGMEIIV